MTEHKLVRSKVGDEFNWPFMLVPGTRETDPESEFEREIRFEPGHWMSSRGSGPSGNYGIGSMNIRMLLHGPKATMQFVWSTGIVPQKVEEKSTVGNYVFENWQHSAPMGMDVGYHADAPVYDDMSRMECDIRPGGFCYYDGSGLAGDALFERFLLEGEHVVWETLEARYLGWIEGRDAQDAIEAKPVGETLTYVATRLTDDPPLALEAVVEPDEEAGTDD